MNSQYLRRKEGTFLTVLNGLERVITAAPVVVDQFVRFCDVIRVVSAVETLFAEVVDPLHVPILVFWCHRSLLHLAKQTGHILTTA